MKSTSEIIANNYSLNLYELERNFDRELEEEPPAS